MVKNKFRANVDSQLDSLIQRFYETVPYAQHMMSEDAVNMEYYKRHTIETVLRIRLKRTVDALAIRYFTKCDPERAQAWAHYTEDEMLHDKLFVADLIKVGLTKEEVYAYEPMLATKLLMGYLLYGAEYENSPLALISSVYFVEYTTTRTQPAWLNNLERVLGEEKLAGARAHVNTDLDDDHDDFVWEVLATLVNTPEDEAKVLQHIHNVYLLYEAYFVALHEAIIEGHDEQHLAIRPELVGQ